MTAYRIGIDVGGTNTDAAILNENLTCIATAKVPTTVDVFGGVRAAIEQLLSETGIASGEIGLAMLGTTHCTNAIVERKRLRRVGLLRLAGPSSASVPPLANWPRDLAAAVGLQWRIVGGGYEYDGRLLSRLVESEIRSTVRQWRGCVDAIAVCGVFSNINPEQERLVEQWVADELGAIPVTLSHRTGSVGFLPRENASILNAALGDVIEDVIAGFGNALKATRLDHARAMIGQNDGTLMSADVARAFPVLTIGCGPTNSLKGAAFLSGRKDAIVIDVGGTTADIGMLTKGFPRQSALAVDIGGVRTNFRMPDIISLGIGGGTVIGRGPDGVPVIGPQSVGYRLTSEAMVFGGSTLTLTDVASVLGTGLCIGDRVPDVSVGFCRTAFNTVLWQLASGVDRIRTSGAPLPVILVGGGSALFPDRIDGADEVIRPANFGAANAIGVAIGDVSGEVDRIVTMRDDSRDETLASLRDEAIRAAVHAGADPATVEILEQEDVPLSYLPGNATRIRFKVAGRLVSSANPSHRQ
ncbi:hydantoinase/oxoprolinase N-terminal domain-containing protein [Burkholderia territorii]|uniref:Hydantoinase/oxoprolinase family protein n=2 Tax=Burkholderia territorii TaxID=1503055 RepID=A0A6L3NPS1_9BURK|nr:hydantoinase/oxoprolinase family protein [Burkholderia territorii]KAB0686357.1 hydantoinase/oxoprolinase family protein [Burkholderia territorii]MBM2775943.1 hydantoinase/oxoprolinase family protein [Burkholderia territorii]VWB48455.1 hydantoinase [Burkholderia territorii]